MCGFSAVVGAVGLGVNLIGKRREAKAREQEYRANADAAEADAETAAENAKFMDLKIKDALYRGSIETKRVAREGRQVQGRQRAAMAANGVDLSFGSPLDLIYQTTLDVMRDISISDDNTRSEIIDLEQERMNYRRQAAGSSAAARSSRRGGKAAARGGTLTVLGGALQGASDLYQAHIT